MQDEVEFIAPPNRLRDKVTRLDDRAAGPAFDADSLKALGAEFVARLPDSLSAIKEAFERLRQSPGSTQASNRLFRLVHDLKGQAGTFDYDLITVIANDLCRFLERPTDFTTRRLKVVGFHIEAMQRVADERIVGEGGERGRRMIDTLHRMTRKVLND